MKLATLELRRFDVPFRTRFRHASAERARTENAVVVATTASGVAGYGEGCPRSYVTGEDAASVADFFAHHADSLARSVVNVASLEAWRDARIADIDRNPAAYCAMEMAVLDALGRESGMTVEQLLGLSPLADTFRFSAVLGDSAWPLYRLQLLRYRWSGFRDFKLKLSPDMRRNRSKLAPLRDKRARFRVRADANNLWPDADACIEALGPLDFPWFALEEPVAAHRLDDCRRVSDALKTRIVLDESFTGRDQLALLRHDADRWLLNLRVSKLGGLTRAIEVAEEARRLGFGLVVGAHVGETSLLTRAGLTLAMAAGGALVAQEGAFGTYLLERDLTEPSIRFGAGGRLTAAEIPSSGGLGLAVDPACLSRPQGGSDPARLAKIKNDYHSYCFDHRNRA